TKPSAEPAMRTISAGPFGIGARVFIIGIKRKASLRLECARRCLDGEVAAGVTGIGFSEAEHQLGLLQIASLFTPQRTRIPPQFVLEQQTPNHQQRLADDIT